MSRGSGGRSPARFFKTSLLLSVREFRPLGVDVSHSTPEEYRMADGKWIGGRESELTTPMLPPRIRASLAFLKPGVSDEELV
jgi:hypothetical protein